MDITLLFKACVKAVKATNKSLGIPEKGSTLLRTTAKDEHLKEAKLIIKQISNLQKFFLDNKIAYLNVVNYLSTNKTMTELDRAEIDAEAQRIITKCNSMISEYRKYLGKQNLTAQSHEHYTSIVISMQDYLKMVSTVYTEAKAVRVKKVLEIRKISKLETSLPKDEQPLQLKSQVSNSSQDGSVANDLTAEEMQMFESENDMLYNELNSRLEEVKQMESKVVHIAELQELFTEKVLQQDKDIDRIANVTAATTDEVRGGNEQLRQVNHRNAGMRVWILFFLLVMSFSMLFLDWYNE